MIPGSNILEMAFNLIARQTVTYEKWLSRAPRADGVMVDTYAPVVTLQGSVQPVDAKLKQIYGLDMQSEYITFYASTNVLAVDRGVTSDRLMFAGRSYKVVGDTPWFTQDGWKSVLCVRLPT